MKLLSILIILLHNVINPTAAAAISAIEPLEFTCTTGCLPSAEEDWRRVCGGLVGLEPKSSSLSSGVISLSCGAINRPLSRAERERVTSVESRSILLMTPAKYQSYIRSCSAFAVAACIEYLVPGLTVSEAELYLRIRLLGELGRSNDGAGLHNYVALLREGIIRAEDFIPYEDWVMYFCKRNVLAISDDFKDSVEDIVRHRAIPHTAVVKPSWRIKPFYIKYRGVVECEVREGYWREQIFNCFPLKTRPEAGEDMSEDILNYFKHILNSVPIIVSVATFIESDFKDGDTWGSNTEGNRRLQARGCIIDIPERGAPPIYKIAKGNINDPRNGWHALCFCGYDNSMLGGKGAFRIKNSWSPFWADNGFAWLSYAYVKEYIGSAMVILTHPTDGFIDADLARGVRPTAVTREYDRVATATFDTMLAAYNARRR